MRLLDTETGRFLEIANPTDLPYAILSHTWDPKGEQTYQDVRKIQATYEAPSMLRDRKSTRLNSSHSGESRMPSSA